MDQKDKSIHDEIQEMTKIREADGSEDGWLSTNHQVETVSDFEMFAEQLTRTADDPHRWKWAIIALHCALQGMMVLAVRRSDGSNVLWKHKRTRLFKWFRCCRSKEHFQDNSSLASFLDLYKKIKGTDMEMYSHSRRFVPKGTQGRSIKRLNRLRNEYIHFTPKHWLLETAGLPEIALDCLEIAEFLAWESGNVYLVKPELNERLKAAFVAAHNSSAALQRKTE